MRRARLALLAFGLSAHVACGSSTSGGSASSSAGGPDAPPPSPAGGPPAPKPNAGSVDSTFGKDGVVVVGPTWSKIQAQHWLDAREDGSVSVFAAGTGLVIGAYAKVARYDIDPSGKVGQAVRLPNDAGGRARIPIGGGRALSVALDGCFFFTANGALDESLGSRGFVTLEGLREPVALDTDGRIYASIGSRAVRITPTCTIDTTWRKDEPPNVDDGYWAQALVDQDGAVVRVGKILDLDAPRWAIHRVRRDGTADSSFGTAGKLVDPSPGPSRGVGVVRDAQGRLLFTTMSWEDGPGWTTKSTTFAFQRFAGGKRDASFAPRPTTLPGSWSLGGFVTFGDGRIYASGFHGEEIGAKKAVVMAFTEAGELATDFGDAGIVSLELGEGGELSAAGLAPVPAGKLTVLVNATTSYFRGDGVNATGGGFAVFRLNR